ncbi:FtsX-like permease family protein, partial [Lactobacillus helveticus]|uniref:FtsX-like permease family protein n=1 Tax=Lactobacillus helveticus TaxID=1587 RepID=UPI001562A935
TVYKITVIIIFIVLIILYVIFAIKDKQRIYEFGIIKCLGFSDKDISKILIINSVKIGSLYAVCSIVLLLIIYMGLVFSGFVSGIFFLLLGVFIVLILSYILTTLASLLPMLRIKNIDPIDIINESKIDTL